MQYDCAACNVATEQSVTVASPCEQHSQQRTELLPSSREQEPKSGRFAYRRPNEYDDLSAYKNGGAERGNSRMNVSRQDVRRYRRPKGKERRNGLQAVTTRLKE